MQKNHACEKKYSKCTKELTLSNNCKFVRSSWIIVQLNIYISKIAAKYFGNFRYTSNEQDWKSKNNFT